MNISMVRMLHIKFSGQIKFSVLYLVITGLNLAVAAQSTTTQEIKWREDIGFMYDFIVKSHKNPYHTITKKRFDSSFTNLLSRIGKLNRIQVITELGKIIAGIGDGHTRLQFFRPEVKFHIAPIRLYHYEDGIFIQAIDSSMAWAVGAEVIKIGNTPIQDALRKIATVTSADNFSGINEFAAKYASITDLLNGLSLSDDSLLCSYTIRLKDGKTRVIRLKGEAMYSTREFLLFEPVSKRYIRDRDSSNHPLPEYLENAGNILFYKLMQHEQLLYVQVNETRNDPSGYRLRDFFNRAVKVFDSASCIKFVLDLRLNRGGDASLLKPIIQLITSHPVINKRGNFFTIIGRRTFSAAGQFVTELAENTEVILVGEPSGTGPNRYGETGEANLPNSGIRITVSTQWIQRGSPEDKTKFFGPELYTPLTSLDYKTNRDPSMEIIKAGTYDSSTYDQLMTRLETDTVSLSSFKTLFQILNDSKLYKFHDFENQLQRLAIFYMRKNRYKMAERILDILIEHRNVTADTYELLATICGASGELTKQLINLKMAIKRASGFQQFYLAEYLKELQSKIKN